MGFIKRKSANIFILCFKFSVEVRAARLIFLLILQSIKLFISILNYIVLL
jgi:hypothetical protein